jgi:S1-C subfamily serine protease
MRTGRLFTSIIGGAIGAALIIAALSLFGVIGGSAATGTTKSSNSFASYSGALTPQQIYQKDVGSVVEIVSTFPGTTDIFGQSSGGGQGIGTGFVVSKDGYILTNAHVVNDNGQAASDVQVVFKGSGSQTTKVTSTVVGADENTDVALIKVDPSQTPTLVPIPLGQSSNVQVGQQVVAIGNPLGLDFSLSSGVVSAVGRSVQSPDGATIANALQTDASINPGNSGGPLIDAHGNVIGINEQIASQSGGNEGIGFAVPIDTAVQTMNQIKSGALSQSQAQQQQQTDPSQGLSF